MDNLTNRSQVTFKVHAFLRTAVAVVHLPIESVNEVMRMAKEIVSTGAIPVAVLIFLRIFPTGQETKPYTILDSSPLVAEPDVTSPSDTTSTVPTITRWVLRQLCKAVDAIHVEGLSLYNGAGPCFSVLSQGKCYNPSQAVGNINMTQAPVTGPQGDVSSITTKLRPQNTQC